MLLSFPTWIVHLLTVSEWLAAILLLRRYAILIDRARLQWFAYAMIPHLLAGIAVLGFHLSGDRLDWLIDLSRVLTFLGSLSLLAAILLLMPRCPLPCGWLVAAVIGLGLIWTLAALSLTDQWPTALRSGANLFYLGFLMLLLVVYRQDHVLFSPVTVLGFWFLLVFVAVTAVTMQIATEQLGLPSLSHADRLHGLSESLLSVSNLLIAIGIYRRLRGVTLRRQLPARTERGAERLSP